LLVGYTPAMAPLWRHLTPVLERELGRVAEGRLRRYWDRSNIPQRKRRMKCGIMGNWRCISDSARCPCLRSHWVNCLVPSCWMKVCVISWVLRSIRASQIIDLSDHERMVSAWIQQCCPCRDIPPGASHGQPLEKCDCVSMGYLC
jgi:hypothetical protein